MPAPDLLPDAYATAYAAMLRTVGRTPRLRRRELVAFWPMRGGAHEPGRGLMVVGRAVNDWEQDAVLRLEDVAADEGAADRMEAARLASGNLGMGWVTDSAGTDRSADGSTRYNTNRSPFWNLARLVNERVNPGTDHGSWSQRLCWSNLYKVSPTKAGNPSDSFCRAQLPGCIELLRLEVATWRPRIVLVVAGRWWWKPFVEGLALETRDAAGPNVEAVARQGETTWVFTIRPEGRALQPFVEEVLAAI